VNRLDFLKGRLRSLSTSHRFDYQNKYTVRPYQGSEDEWETSIDFNPIIRISALTQGNIRIDNSVRFRTEERIRRPKIELPGTEKYDEEDYIKIPWLHMDKIVDRGYGFGDELAISYSLKTKRGFQLWRWYVKLDNDIDLRLESAYSYKKQIQESYKPVGEFTDPYNPSGSTGVVHYVVTDPNTGEIKPSYEPELEKLPREVPTRAHEWYIRPKVAYTFSKLASASAYIEYRWLRELLSYGGTHTRQSLSFEIAAMLRFN
jgi:cell surface protein SprA